MLRGDHFNLDNFSRNKENWVLVETNSLYTSCFHISQRAELYQQQSKWKVPSFENTQQIFKYLP